MQRPISIVIPIYNAREMTLRCIASVLEHARGEWRLILVDDCSSDTGLSDELKTIAGGNPRVTLLRNAINLGFVGTANAGMVAAGQDDLLLLNSDTEVFEGFLGRIAAAALADESTGIVSPFSNNATLCSIPIPFQDNAIPAGFTPAELNRLVASCSLRQRPEIPTAVGFCMYIRHEVLADTGLFNFAVYGRGFGEENDFCELAKEAGWKIRLADDVFVYHKGKASFGLEGHEREARNLAILEERHPGYLASIQRFAADNPLAPLQASIRLRLRRQGADGRGALLFLLHKSPFTLMPGGTEYHVIDLVKQLALGRAVIAWPEENRLAAAEIFDGDVTAAVVYRFPLAGGSTQFSVVNDELSRTFRRMVADLGVVAAHLHHLMFWPVLVWRVLEELGVPFVYTFHDYFAVCPNWNLFDANARKNCPCDGTAACSQSCLPAFFADHSPYGPPGGDFARYREEHHAAFAGLLSASSRLIFPSQAALREASARQEIAPSRCEVIEHGYDPAPSESAGGETTEPGAGQPLRLLVLGEVGVDVKGREAYIDLVVRTRAAPIEWHFVGQTPELSIKPRMLEAGLSSRVTFHGRVDRDDIMKLIRQIAPAAGVLMPAWHETFSYVLSELLVSGVPVLTNDYGAPAERLRAHGCGWVVGSVEEAAAKLLVLAANPALIAAEREKLRSFRHKSLHQNADEYRKLYADEGFVERLAQPREPEPRAIANLAAHWSERNRPSNGLATAAAFAQPPDPAYQKQLWYQQFLKIKRLVPGSIRRYGRDTLLRYQYQTFRVLRPEKQAKTSGVRLIKRGLAESTWMVRSRDPQFVFTLDPLSSGKVKLLRFRMLQELDLIGSAQIYWTHGPHEPFDETRSATVQLNGHAGVWGEYLLRLDGGKVGPAWRKGEKIYRLRFDPIDQPGIISLGPIELGG